MFCRQSTSRTLLFAGVSSLALTVGAAELRAADLAPQPRPVLKAAPPVVAPVLTIWIEGAAIWTGGSDMNAFNPAAFSDLAPAGPAFIGQRPSVGWEVAFGADYRLAASPWHVSFDFRYGRSKAKTKNFANSFFSSSDGFSTFSANQVRVAEHESHMVADFMIGHDFGFGGGLGMLGLNQVKVGIRVADLRAHQSMQAQHAFSSSQFVSSHNQTQGASAASLNINARSEFLGIGPRVAAEGVIPLGGGWSADWAGGLAVLFGRQKFDADFNGNFASAGFSIDGNEISTSKTAFTFSGNLCAPNGAGGTALALNCHTDKAVFNADISGALSYAITPRAKLSAGVRFDGYWGALRTLDNHFTGLAVNTHNEDRFYWGPFVRLTGAF